VAGAGGVRFTDTTRLTVHADQTFDGERSNDAVNVAVTVNPETLNAAKPISNCVGDAG
jgi:hypothetical protein